MLDRVPLTWTRLAGLLGEDEAVRFSPVLFDVARGLGKQEAHVLYAWLRRRRIDVEMISPTQLVSDGAGRQLHARRERMAYE